jgi:hypothetical protein
MQMQNNVKDRRRWRKKALAKYWGVCDRTVDRMVAEGRLGKPKYIGRMPTWSDEQREEAERAERTSASASPKETDSAGASGEAA